jgi:molecular chaperone GrpE (heat shock protein)
MSEFSDGADALCGRMDAVFAEKLGATPPLQDVVEFQALKARLQRMVALMEEIVKPRVDAIALAVERDKWRAYIAAQAENTRTREVRHSNDMMRAEELTLRPRMLTMLPVLDALDLARADAEQPGCDAPKLVEAMIMIGDGLKAAVGQ